MFEFVTVGDPHIDAYNRFFATEDDALDAQFEEIEKPFQYAVRHNVPHVVVLGDIGEHSTLSENGKRRLLQLLIKYDGQLKIWIILGNHDWLKVGDHSMRLFALISKHCFRTVRVFETPEQMDIDDVTVNFLPFPAKARLKGGPALNFAHLELRNALRDNGHKVERGVKLEDDGDSWVSGHLHTYQKGPNFLYPGTGWQKNFGEKGPKGWCHCRAQLRDDGKKVEVTHTHIDGKPRLKLFNWKDATVKQLATVSRDPRHLYKIVVAEGVEIPPALRSYPNVIEIRGVVARPETEAPDQSTGDLDIHKPVLKSLGLDKAGRAIARSYMARALKEIGA